MSEQGDKEGMGGSRWGPRSWTQVVGRWGLEKWRSRPNMSNKTRKIGKMNIRAKHKQ
jgi:hypothetical protein